MKYVGLLRGINVGGKNKIPMIELKACLESLGYTNVRTYIASGNVLFESPKKPAQLTEEIQNELPKKFALDSQLIKIVLLTEPQLRKVLEQAPDGFGSEPAKYHTDVIFMMDISTDDAFTVFNPREGVDRIWQGDLAIYSQRLSAERTKSRLNTIMASPLYKSMTIRTFTTTKKLFELLRNE